MGFVLFLGIFEGSLGVCKRILLVEYYGVFLLIKEYYWLNTRLLERL